MFYPDLYKAELGDGYAIVAVGWLTETQLFAKGPVSKKFLRMLRGQIKRAWQPALYRGLHDCELCIKNPHAESLNLFIPSGRILYCAPAMIDHYICKHGYQPPQEFLQAVMASPAQDTPEYLQAVRCFSNPLRLFDLDKD